MKYECFLAVLAFFVLSCGKKEKRQGGNTDPFLNCAGYFEEHKKLALEDGGKLWGISLYGPLLFIDQNTRQVYANQPSSLLGLQWEHGVYTGKLPDSIPMANTAMSFDGTYWTMMLLPLPENSSRRRALMMHESFHSVQPTLGFDFSKIDFYSCNHLNEKKGRVYLKLELEALKMAMNESEAGQIMQHIDNAILFRLYRYDLYPKYAASENAMELLEGIPEYTGLLMSGLDRAGIQAYYATNVNRFYASRSFVRSFAYHTMPAYGYLMQGRDPKWNKKIDVYTNLTSYIMDFYGIKRPRNLEYEVDIVKYDYGFAEIMEAENARELQTQQQMKNFRDLFFKTPTLKFHSDQLSYAINPESVIPLEPEGTIFQNLTITAEWGVLQVNDNYVFIGKENDYGILAELLEINKAGAVGKGWELYLKNGWHVVKGNSDYLIEEIKP
ncbi:MAG: hypothetical protein Tsb004_28040 [Allomuricauda sp.]